MAAAGKRTSPDAQLDALGTVLREDSSPAARGRALGLLATLAARHGPEFRGSLMVRLAAPHLAKHWEAQLLARRCLKDAPPEAAGALREAAAALVAAGPHPTRPAAFWKLAALLWRAEPPMMAMPLDACAPLWLNMLGCAPEHKLPRRLHQVLDLMQAAGEAGMGWPPEPVLHFLISLNDLFSTAIEASPVFAVDVFATVAAGALAQVGRPLPPAWATLLLAGLKTNGSPLGVGPSLLSLSLAEELALAPPPVAEELLRDVVRPLTDTLMNLAKHGAPGAACAALETLASLASAVPKAHERLWEPASLLLLHGLADSGRAGRDPSVSLHARRLLRGMLLPTKFALARLASAGFDQDTVDELAWVGEAGQPALEPAPAWDTA